MQQIAKTLSQKNVLLAISGGIAAYKSAVLARLLIQSGADVRVVMTQGAQAFIQPLTFQALTHHPVATQLLDEKAESGMGHIELARWADLIVIAPATANLIARLAHGFADDLLTTICLASKAPRYLAPAMNQQMWAHAAVKHNVSILEQQGWSLLGPDSGEQACGDEGMGRMLEPSDIVTQIAQELEPPFLEGLKLVINAGPTQEALDPVRYLTNRSSGKMGYALATQARLAGAEVRLISGPVNLPAPSKVSMHYVKTAADMLLACQSACETADIFISAAAVTDYYVPHISTSKIKKTSGSNLSLTLEPTIDIVKSIATAQPNLFCVGFAAETDNLEQAALEKLTRKNVRLMIANQVSETQGFERDENAVDVFWFDDKKQIDHEHFPLQSKTTLAKALLKLIATVYHHTPS